MSRVLIFLAVWQGLAAMTFAGAPESSDWPQYLGPNRDSTSPEKGLSRSWPDSGPKVLWTVAVGDRIYIRGTAHLFCIEEHE